MSFKHVLAALLATTTAPAAVLAQAAPSPSAELRVRAQLDSAPQVPRGLAAWLPMQVLQGLAQSTGELAAPTSPRARDGSMVWSYLLPLRRDVSPPDAARQQALCAPLRALQPGVQCEADLVSADAGRRERVVVGWRLGDGSFPQDLGLPLRALARLGGRVCLRSAERSLHTVELDLWMPDAQTLGRTLAFMASVPGLSGLVLMSSEPLEGGLRTRLLWPTDGVERASGTLGDEPWPARCHEHARVAVDAPAREAILVRAHLSGARAHGAVVAAHGREWFVTEGDQVGDGTITSATAAGILARRGRGRPARLAERAESPSAAGPSTGARRPSSVVPLPPDPPAVVQPLR